MLTNREKKWLKKRERFPFYGCQYCEFDKFGRHCMSEGIKANNGKMRCLIVPKKDAFKEAAEFEARVAALLADPTWAVCRHGDSCIEHGGDKQDAWIWLCEVCRMKHAHLTVEGEMDA